MLRHILPLIPKHRIYVEPFFGGGAVFWAKERAEVEVINDTNDWVITFYRVLKNPGKHAQLMEKLNETLHSRQLHRRAKEVLLRAGERDAVEIAWAVWVQTQMSFAKCIFKGWGYGKASGGGACRCLSSKIDALGRTYSERLRRTYIESLDALKVINAWDDAEAFFYCDPPYFNSDMGHYKNYTEGDFVKLLDRLCTIKGKFLLSSYPCGILTRYVAENNWKVLEFHKKLAVFGKRKVQKVKTECLVRNY